MLADAARGTPHWIGGVKFPDHAFMADDPAAPYWLRGLSGVNLIVGPNNSGKSRLLRQLFTRIGRNRGEHLPPYAMFEGLLDLIQSQLEDRSPGERHSVHHNYAANVRYKSGEPWGKAADQLLKIVAPLNSPSSHLTGANIELLRTLADDNSKGLIQSLTWLAAAHGSQDSHGPFVSAAEGLKRAGGFGPSVISVYVPSLRGMRPFPGVDGNPYLNRTLKDYFPHWKDDFQAPAHPHAWAQQNVFTGLELFLAVRSRLLGDLAARKQIREFERILSTSFFDGRDIALIPREHDGNDVLYVKIGREKEQAIFDLGDGVAQIAVIAYLVFRYSTDDLLLFIEEPESHLHPGFQRALIEMLADPSTTQKSRQSFVVTHSNHLLDAALDVPSVAIFRVLKEGADESVEEYAPKCKVSSTSHRDVEMLTELGVRVSSVALTNCTIWVEGITDRMYLKHYLTLFQASNEEGGKPRRQFALDVHYSFVEYAGANIGHFVKTPTPDQIPPIDVSRLCGKALFVADNDESKEKKHEMLFNALHGKYLTLDVVEVENLVSPQVLTKVLEEYEGGAEKLHPPTAWQSRLKNTRLGTLIDDHILVKSADCDPTRTYALERHNEGTRRTKGTRRKRGTSSRTIRNKVEFAQRVIAHTLKLDDMSPSARKLARELYEFISQNNQRARP